MYCDFSADKQYQLADWRVRPLPDPMIDYARSDTHFLLFIYDNLRNALLDRGLSRSRSQSQARSRSSSPPSKKKSKSPSPPIKTGDGDSPPHALLHEVLARSSVTALKVYEREMYDAEGGLGPGGWEGLARKWNKATLLSGDNEQGRVYRAVHAWRDKAAREEDESVRYVLPNHHIFQFAERPPKDMAGLLAMFPTSRVPPVVRTRARELLDTILRALRGAPSTSASGNAMVVDRKAEESVAQPQALVEDESDPRADSELPSLDSDSSIRIWATEKSTTESTTKVSALLGTSKKSTDGLDSSVSAYVSLRSSFLNVGHASGRKNISTNGSYAEDRIAKFTEVLQRIHASLTIMPKAPQAPSAQNIETNTDVTGQESTMDVDASAPVQLGTEIAFVPRSERKTLATTEVEDTIILVGQRAKKRKRKDTKSASSEPNGDTPAPGSSSAKKVKKTRSIEVEVEDEVDGDDDSEKPFDFSSVPNILDDEPIKEDAKPKRQRKQSGKGEVFGYGNFPRPPKAHSELRSGNQSHTFKK
ncbi:exosome nuclease subunit [Pleurotus pulmonarius]|nr:exosome nuclease subunit [Pleurotus pulmonarius]KAF4590365.1 exosome nuclease subunit [Pleurotus pulmonarius]KAF4590648.1 exosome nuclease subunit [Pleurotus pulmonarius]